ncbi:MAG: DUF1674 domain-containing protein [Parvibaculum sp.]
MSEERKETGSAAPNAETPNAEAPSRPPVSEAAKRALSEAEARRAKESAADLPKEHLGREGPEPTRFGDWEHNGLISDF